MYNIAFVLYTPAELALFANFSQHLERFRAPQPIVEVAAAVASDPAQLELPLDKPDEKIVPITSAPSLQKLSTATPTATMEAATAAIRAYVAAKGVAEARKLLDTFKVNRVTDLQDAQLADFIRAAAV